MGFRVGPLHNSNKRGGVKGGVWLIFFSGSEERGLLRYVFPARDKVGTIPTKPPYDNPFLDRSFPPLFPGLLHVTIGSPHHFLFAGGANRLFITHVVIPHVILLAV